MEVAHPSEHPAFYPGALGPMAGRVFEVVLGSRSVERKELVKSLGVSRDTVKRAVAKLVERGLVRVTTPHGPNRPVVEVAHPTVDVGPLLDRIAESAGTHDWITRATERYQLERDADATARAEWESREAEASRQAAKAPNPFDPDDPLTPARVNFQKPPEEDPFSDVFKPKGEEIA